MNNQLKIVNHKKTVFRITSQVPYQIICLRHLGLEVIIEV